MDADFIAYEFDFVVRKEEQGFSYISNNKHIHLPIPSLIGDHQYINAATAIAAMEHLKSYSISDEAIVKGVSSAKWMARLQRLTQGNLYKLLPSHFEIWIDGAHNDAGADVLSLWAGDQDDCDIFLICGITKGRDVKSFLKRFVNKVKFVGGMLVESEPSSYQASQISEASISLNIDSLPFASFSDAISHFVKINEKNKAKIIVCGSLYLAGDALSQN